MKEKLLDIQAMIDYITALSIKYKTRISIFTVPPEGLKDRYVHVSMGFSDSFDVSGYGDTLTVRWTENGEKISESFGGES